MIPDILSVLLAGDPAAISDARAQVRATLGSGQLAAIGEAEREVAADPGHAIRFDSGGAATVVVGDVTYAAGRFTTPTLAELRRAAAQVSSRGGPITLTVFDGSDLLTDIGALQAWAATDTTFQVASQFNALESPGPDVRPVVEYVHDPTQGPRAAVGAFPATLVRHYACPDEAGSRFTQTTRRSLNLLADALPADVARVTAGYLTTDRIQNPAAAAAALADGFERIRVGVSDGVEVTLGAEWGGSVPSGARITQVCTSTIAGGGYGGAIRGEWTEVARPLLRAAYLGTMLAAAATGRRRVVLTMIGGGVFGNPHPLILDAVVWACDEVGRAGAGPLEVILNGHGLDDDVDRQWLADAVTSRGGRVIHVEGARGTTRSTPSAPGTPRSRRPGRGSSS